MMILMSAAFVDREKAREQLAVGLGTLAGSTCFLLTIPWSISLLLAKVDFKIVKNKSKNDNIAYKNLDNDGKVKRMNPFFGICGKLIPFSVETKDGKNKRWWDPLFTGIFFYYSFFLTFLEFLCYIFFYFIVLFYSIF